MMCELRSASWGNTNDCLTFDTDRFSMLAMKGGFIKSWEMLADAPEDIRLV